MAGRFCGQCGMDCAAQRDLRYLRFECPPVDPRPVERRLRGGALAIARSSIESVGLIPTEGLPPRPVQTRWEFSPEWHGSVVMAKSHWPRMMERIWRDLQVKWANVFDVVRCTPMVSRDDGPDKIIGAHFDVVQYPFVISFQYAMPVHGPSTDSFFDRMRWRLGKEHQLARVKRWRTLEPLPMLCLESYWWSPKGLAERVMTYDAARRDILTGDPRALHRTRALFGLAAEEVERTVQVPLDVATYTGTQ